MIQGKLLTYGEDITEVINIRKTVFGQLDVTGTCELKEEQAIHVLVYESKDETKAIAAGSIYYDGQKCFIDNVAVLSEYRLKRYGDFAVRMLLNKAFLSGIVRVYIKTPVTTSDFFKKIGFIKEGNDYKDNNISYVTMLIEENNLTVMCKR
jgi:N-acetylglutamate synthase-like GNAT family acetyltransferase